jgi:methyl-accepting chemotaxis protein
MMLFLDRRVIRRVSVLSGLMSVAGTGDLSGRSGDLRPDEIGDINGSFNALLENIGALVAEVQRSFGSLKEAGEELSTSIRETAAAVNQISSNVAGTNRQNELQDVQIQETTAFVEQLTRNVESLDGQIRQQGEAIDQSSSAVEELVSNIQSIGSMTANGRDAISRLNGIPRRAGISWTGRSASSGTWRRSPSGSRKRTSLFQASPSRRTSWR